MPISLEQNTQTSAKSSKSAALLNKYLTEAVHLTHSDTLFEANRYLSDFATRPRWEEIKREDIDAKRQEIKKELKEYGFKDRAAYYGNIKAGDHFRETMVKMGIVVTATAVAAAISPELGHAVAGAGLAYMGSKVAAKVAGAPTTPKELFSTRDYTDLKHAQMALRTLSRHLEKKELNKMKQEAMIKGVYFPISGRGGIGY